MKNFAKYAKYYDLLYKDKNYREEADYTDNLIRDYSGRHVKTLLDIGCGTGRHDVWLAAKGYQVTGIDRSPEMIAIARKKLPAGSGVCFRIGNAVNLALHEKFDAAISLFHVMSYMGSNEMIMESLKRVRRHLKKSGLFIFDFWYGPAVLAERPRLRRRIIKDGRRVVRRSAEPSIDMAANTVDIRYRIDIKHGSNFTNEFSEHHIMRYFFLPELRFMLKTAGFEVVKCLRWMSEREGVSEKDWSGLVIARRN